MQQIWIFIRRQLSNPIRAAGAELDGVPMEQIRDALSHSTVKITEQHYAQIHPDYRVDAREYAKRTYASDVTYKV